MPIPAPPSGSPASAPCGWDVDPAALGVCSDWADLPETTQTAALQMAELYLWSATGRRFGVCTVTVRPAQQRWGAPEAYRAFPLWPGQQGGDSSGMPFLFGGQWFNTGTCSSCCNASGCVIVLRGPVATVEQAVIGEEIIPASAYRVDATRGVYLLVRTDGECWPSCNSDDSPFEVTYGQGTPVPDSLAVATALLACEYSKALTGGPCKLPARMTRLSRQGVDIEVEPADSEAGTTGIREVDDVIAALNPGKRQRPPALLSPDLPEDCDRVTVWSGA